MTKGNTLIPIIDLFAGPGGLGEGFSSFEFKGKRQFEISLSVEKDFHAHQTLELRAFFRQFPKGGAPQDYYNYIRGGRPTREELFEAFPKQAEKAVEEARLQTLGEDDIGSYLDASIKTDKWVLIGGPPCQAYSLVGRARMVGKGLPRSGETDEAYESRLQEQKNDFESDSRHTLYREYLNVIEKYWPAAFVMENVKGILSSKIEGERIFPKILDDLKDPGAACHEGKSGKHTYKIYSLVCRAQLDGHLDDRDFLIKAEDHGIPQARHRVILLGVRDDIDHRAIEPLVKQDRGSVRSFIYDLPPLTSGLSKNKKLSPYEALLEITKQDWWKAFIEAEANNEVGGKMLRYLGEGAKSIYKSEKRGGRFVKFRVEEREWFYDERLEGVSCHETRTHMQSDLWRYFFSSCFTEVHGTSPRLRDFPEGLLPNHKNVEFQAVDQKFADRFRTQDFDSPSTTITSHISKDGHYFIHPDPRQYRSLTVREAARLQTFPDNYFFEGPRTQQFHQVGNAVPPLLGRQIAERVFGVLKSKH